MLLLVYFGYLFWCDNGLFWRPGEPLHDAVPLHVDDLDVAPAVPQHDVQFAVLARRLNVALTGFQPGLPPGENQPPHVVLIKLAIEQVEARDWPLQGREAQPGCILLGHRRMKPEKVRRVGDELRLLLVTKQPEAAPLVHELVQVQEEASEEPQGRTPASLEAGVGYLGVTTRPQI